MIRNRERQIKSILSYIKKWGNKTLRYLLPKVQLLDTEIAEFFHS